MPTGWEPQFTIAVDSLIDLTVVMELCEKFFSKNPPTQIKLRAETLSWTLEALTSGQADLALGVVMDSSTAAGIHGESLGNVRFMFVVAPTIPLRTHPNH